MLSAADYAVFGLIMFALGIILANGDIRRR